MKDNETIFLNLAQRILNHLAAGETNASNEVPPQILYVTSVNRSEGKTFLAKCIAYYIANLVADKVLLVDGNFESPTLHEDYNLLNQGFSELLVEGCWKNDDFYQATTLDNLKVLAAGSQNNKGLLFKQSTLNNLRENIPSEYSIIIVDGARLELGGKSMIQSADSSILVVDASSTRREVIQGVMSNYAIQTEKIFGAVLNKKTHYIPNFIYRHL